ncbi:HAD-IC family P-type ATPase [Spiroplasma endosymbiont of Aspidapion aeneum]|uniref:HAD-IC family P-type ATPase n=1 Tax=Spiroplasma endosymbiont of Aspidapion aeneum TaxID=3066276 RepID=UPI00313B9B0C
MKINEKQTKKIKYKNTEYLLNVANNVKNDFLEEERLGIKEEDRKKFQASYGKNELTIRKFSHWYKVIEILISPFNILLLTIATIELLLYFFYDKSFLSLFSAGIVYLMVLLAGVVNHIQDYKAYKSSINLHKLVENKYFVYKKNIDITSKINPANIREDIISILETDIVVGDIVYLNGGDVVPADCKIIWMDDLVVNESSLTGESDPIYKKYTNNRSDTIELENILFSQATIESGSCLALVVNVGFDNYATSFLAKDKNKKEASSFEHGMKNIIFILIAIIGICTPLICIISGIKTNLWVEAFIFSISVAVGLIPESLPAIVSSNLVVGARKMAKENIVIKDLSVVQNLGGVDILCTDKTGTLTVDEVELDGFKDFDGNETDHLKDIMFVSSFFQKNHSNKIDSAIIQKIPDNWADKLEYEFLDDIEFKFEKRLTGVLAKKKTKSYQITKGSIEELLNISKFVRTKGKVEELSQKHIDKIYEDIANLSSKGYRTIAIASKETKTYSEDNLIFEGIIMFFEKIKENTKEIIQKLYEHNIDLKVLSGDAKEITENLARNLEIRNPRAITGKELNELNEDEWIDVINNHNLFVKLTPYDKAKIVEKLKDKINNVAFMGDGINDAMVISSANVGISVNNATPLTKSVAPIILLEKDLGVLENAFIRGREIFANTLKYIKITIASNVGLLLTLILSTIIFKFPVATPLQLILQNLIFDFVNLLFVFDRVDKKWTKKPIIWNTKMVIPFAIWNGIGATIISLSNFFIMGYGLGYFDPGTIMITNDHKLDMFQTSFFIECITTHMLMIITLRSADLTFIKTFPSIKYFTFLMTFFFFSLIMVYILSLVNGTDYAIPTSKTVIVLLCLVPTAIILQECFKQLYKQFFKDWI